MSPRATSIMRARPRAWQRLVDAQSSVLIDAAWICREMRQPGTIDGTPNFEEAVWGPYKAKLSTPSQEKRREADKWSTETTHTLVIASDVEPLISDHLLVLAPLMLGTSEQVRFWISGDVVTRRTAFARPLVHHLQLSNLTEA